MKANRPFLELLRSFSSRFAQQWTILHSTWLNARRRISAAWLRAHPIIEISFPIPHQRAELAITRTAPFQTPPAQSCKADLRLSGYLEFGQEYFAHVCTSETK